MEKVSIAELKFFLMIVSFALWAIIYNEVRRKYFYKSPRFCCHFVAVTYALLLVILMYLSPELQVSNSTESSKCGGNLFSIMSLTISWGYLSFNLIWALYYHEGTVVYTNFVTSLLLIKMYLFWKTSNPEVIIKGMGFLELCNPSSQAKEYFKKLGKKASSLCKSAEIVILSLLAILRILYGSYYISAVLLNQVYDGVDKLVATYFYVIGLVLFYNIIPVWEDYLMADGKPTGLIKLIK